MISGYTGGDVEDPSYEQVSSGRTGHAEAVQITFDPRVVSYDSLLDVFWATHDPTTLDRQGADVGPQYRSAIFYHSDEQRRTAEASKSKWEASGKLKGKIVTSIEPFKRFYPAEGYHQDYYAANPHALVLLDRDRAQDQEAAARFRGRGEGGIQVTRGKTKATDEMKKKLTPEQYNVCFLKGTEPPFSGKYTAQQGTRDVRLRRLRRRALLFRLEVRFEDGLAVIRPARGEREHRLRGRLLPGHAPDRGDVQELRLSPGPRLRRRPHGDRQALLHQLPRPGLHTESEGRFQIASGACGL